MQKSISELKGYAIGATDGEIGSVDDFLFDDNFWTIRYLVADTNRWLPGGRVLISPIALGKIDWNKKVVSVSLTKEQVKNSPDIDSNDLSREKEMAYHDYYGWPYYWVGGDVWGAEMSPAALAVARRTALEKVEREVEPDDDTILRSAKQTIGYTIEAKDGEIGHAEDFILDDETWEIRYMVVDTRNWWPGKNVLVSPDWIERISWADSRVYVDLSRQAIKTSPEFNPANLDRSYEEKLYEHYTRPGYWDL